MGCPYDDIIIYCERFGKRGFKVAYSFRQVIRRAGIVFYPRKITMWTSPYGEHFPVISKIDPNI